LIIFLEVIFYSGKIRSGPRQDTPQVSMQTLQGMRGGLHQAYCVVYHPRKAESIIKDKTATDSFSLSLVFTLFSNSIDIDSHFPGLIDGWISILIAIDSVSLYAKQEIIRLYHIAQIEMVIAVIE
jgi:hypothetical protein